MALWYTVTFLTMIILIFGFLDYRFRRNLLKEIDRMLVDEAHEIISQTLQNPLRINEQLKAQEEIVLKRQYYPLAFRVFDRQGNLIYASSKLRDFTFPKLSIDENRITESAAKNVESPQKSLFRLCIIYFYRGGDKLKYIVQVATYLGIIQKTIENFREHLLTAFFWLFFSAPSGGGFYPVNLCAPLIKLRKQRNE